MADFFTVKSLRAPFRLDFPACYVFLKPEGLTDGRTDRLAGARASLEPEHLEQWKTFPDP